MFLVTFNIALSFCSSAIGYKAYYLPSDGDSLDITCIGDVLERCFPMSTNEV
jgi:hypothetical protein